MKIKIHRLAAALVGLTIFTSPFTTAYAQGSLTPPGGPAPTMKTLAQIEPRTPISSAPFTISVPGSYYLTTNLTVSGGTAITIATHGVTLDLNGFTIASTAPSATGSGILISSGLRNLAILNGFIQGSVTNNGSGLYSGSGFGHGIYRNGSPQNARVSGVSVSGCRYSGIYLGDGDSTVVESCTVQTVGNEGIRAGTIKASVAKDCGGIAIFGQQVADCHGESTGNGDGLSAITALNCQGATSSGYGLSAINTAQNCYGQSSSGTGLYAGMAQNCYGRSTSGTGLRALTAQNCYAQSTSGTGLYAGHTAQNCYGYSGTYTGLFAADIAIGCLGASLSGTGLGAYIANSCRGVSATGPAQSLSFKYNMP
jgi:parallel beta-helix repeat protein